MTEIPVAHAGELHASDLVIIAPLVLLAVVGIAWLVREARRGDDPSETGRDDAAGADRPESSPQHGDETAP